MRKLTFIAAVVAALVPSAPALALDGEWTVQLSTEAGNGAKDCQPNYQWDVILAAGQVTHGGDASTGASGWMTSDGLASFSFVVGQDVFRAQGKWKGNAASGAWSSPSKYCGGRWKAAKK